MSSTEDERSMRAELQAAYDRLQAIPPSKRSEEDVARIETLERELLKLYDFNLGNSRPPPKGS